MSSRANKILLLAASLATLGLLVVAAYRENWSREWRRVQRDYRSGLPAADAKGFQVHLRQVYVPGLRATDRCISCHVGMAPGETALTGALFGAHPDVVHDPADYGCVTCHGGQGRATEKADAHGDVAHWPEPMIPREYAYAGCGTCHSHLEVPNLSLVDRGRAMVERYDCLSCHSIDGRGGTLRPGALETVSAPDLSRAGGRGYSSDWYERHLDRVVAEDGAWQVSFGEIPAAHRRAIESFLDSRVGAPGLVEAKAVFHSLGCRGCHKVNDVGGDDGPDLTGVGDRDAAQLDFSNVPGEHTLANWLAEHFRAPAAVVPGSRMPALGLTEQQIDHLTFYMLSLRSSAFPEAYWSNDRIRAQRFGEREFATDGATLYGTFCASCHGPAGEGMRYAGMPPFPAIGNAEFLAIASDRFLRDALQHGRSGRRMPAWGEQAGGLTAEEGDAVVAHLRSMAPAGQAAPVDAGPQRWVSADVESGAVLYRDNCASCHGDTGAGVEGPALSNPALLRSATDTYLLESIRRGRPGTSMPPFGSPSPTHRLLSDPEMETIVAFIRTWEVKP